MQEAITKSIQKALKFQRGLRFCCVFFAIVLGFFALSALCVSVSGLTGVERNKGSVQ